MTGEETGERWMKMLEGGIEVDLAGFEVEAMDGAAGRVEQVLYWSDARVPDYVVVDSGRWMFGHKSVLSVRMIEDIDMKNRRLRIRLSRKEVRQAPEFLPSA